MSRDVINFLIFTGFHSYKVKKMLGQNVMNPPSESLAYASLRNEGPSRYTVCSKRRDWYNPIFLTKLNVETTK